MNTTAISVSLTEEQYYLLQNILDEVLVNERLDEVATEPLTKAQLSDLCEKFGLDASDYE